MKDNRRVNLVNSLCYLFFQIRDEAVKAGTPHAREMIWGYFVQKCSNNLHVVLAMSPVGDALRTRCRNFPGKVFNAASQFYMNLV